MKRICLEDPSIPRNPLMNKIYNRANVIRINCETGAFINRNDDVEVFCNDTTVTSSSSSSSSCFPHIHSKLIIMQCSGNVENSPKTKVISVRATDTTFSKRCYPYFQSNRENEANLSFKKQFH